MGLGYADPCPLGQAIASHPKLYDAEVLGLHYVQPDVHDTEEILNDAEENPSISSESESSKEMSDLPTPKMPKESKLLKMFDKMDEAILALWKNIDITLLEDSKRRWISDNA
ncbi:hypothetical protein Tco_1356914 [Tanacetum coccineum]